MKVTDQDTAIMFLSSVDIRVLCMKGCGSNGHFHFSLHIAWYDV